MLADAPERGTPGLLWALSLAQERLGEWEEVLRSAQELASRIPDSPLPRQAQARALLALRRYGEALSRLEGDASPAAAVLRARAALRLQPSDPEAARSALGEVDPEDPAFDAWPAAGELFEPGDPRREALLLARLERHPRDVLGWVDLAHLIRRRPGRDELIRRLREADSHEPFHPRIRELGIAAQLERDGTVHLPERNEEASLLREQLRVIARQDPDRWRAQFLRAQLALEFSDGDEAEQALSAGFGSLYLDLAVANAVAAMLKLDRGEVARGLELSRYAESLAPEFPLAKLAGLRGNLIAGNYPAAGDFAAWLRQNAQEAVPPLEWAKLLLNQDLPRAASVELARNPQRTVEHVLLEACVAHRLGDPARAESLLRQVHDVRGGIYTSYALELFAQTRLGASTEPLMRLRQEAARESDRRLQEGNLESAIEYCAQLLWLADDPRLHARRARLRLFQGEPAQALLDLRLLMRSKSPDTDALLALLGESALRLRRTGFALAVAQELEHRSPEGLATATLLQARAYELLGFTERGLAACERGLGGANTSAPSPRLRGARGMLLERAGRYAEAIADLEAALAAQPPAGEAWSIFPRGSMVCTSLGRALLETGKVDDAERAFKRSGELSVAEHKGVARYGDALGTALLQAIMVEGHAVAAVTGLLECHLARGQEAEARAALRQALRFVLEGHQPRPEDAETLERATLRLR